MEKSKMKTPKQLMAEPKDDLGIDLDIGSLDLSIEEKLPEKPEPIQVEKKKEAGQILQMIRNNEKKWREEMALETSADFYFCIVFKSPTEMKEFCEKQGIELHHGRYCFIEDIKHLFKK